MVLNNQLERNGNGLTGITDGNGKLCGGIPISSQNRALKFVMGNIFFYLVIYKLKDLKEN